MFDTSVVKAHAITAPRRTTLLVSVGLHSIAIVSAITLTLASTQLPAQPPRQMAMYRSFDPPSPPPPPRGRPDAQPHAAAPARPRTQAVAAPATPAVIPDDIPAASAAAPASSLAPESGSPGTRDGGPIGDPNGVDGGVVLDQPTVPEPAVYRPGVGGVTSARVIRRVEPRFPPAFTGAVRRAVVVVRCIIGKDGRIRDAEIVQSSFSPFNDAVLTALNQWTFEPGRAHGEAVDTWFELTVRFEVK